jgi:2-hydroxy-3-oxopropionate reductase
MKGAFSMTKPTIGFIGLGVMGKPMARNLLKAGYPLVVHNRSREPVEELAAEGARPAFSPAEVASRSELIITMLPDSSDVELVALGEDGLIEGVSEGDVYVDMSTIAPAVAVKVANALAEKGVRCLDAPVSGGDVGAREGTLSIMVGGDEDLFNEVLPIFEVMGKTIVHCGPKGAGQTVKACNQIQVALTLIGMAEALVLGAKAGVDPAIVVRVLSGGFAQSRVMDVRGPRVIRRVFEPGFRSKLHYKDLGIVRETARAYGISLPASALAHELFGAMQAQGWGDLDHSAVMRVIELLSDVEVRTAEG